MLSTKRHAPYKRCAQIIERDAVQAGRDARCGGVQFGLNLLEREHTRQQADPVFPRGSEVGFCELLVQRARRPENLPQARAAVMVGVQNDAPIGGQNG